MHVFNHYKRLQTARTAGTRSKDDVEIARRATYLADRYPIGCGGSRLLPRPSRSLLNVPFYDRRRRRCSSKRVTWVRMSRTSSRSCCEKWTTTWRKAQTGIVYIDEIDKISRSRTTRRSRCGRALGEEVCSKRAAEAYLEGIDQASVPSQGRLQAPAARVLAGRHQQYPVHLRWRFAGLKRDRSSTARRKSGASGFTSEVADVNVQAGRTVATLFHDDEPEDLIKGTASSIPRVRRSSAGRGDA